MRPVQIFLIILIVLVIYQIFRKYRAKHFSFLNFLSWLIFWLIILAVIIWPDTSSFLARVFGVGRGADLMIYLGLIVIFYFLFYFTIKIYKLEHDLTKVVRHLALKEKEEKEN